MPEVNFTEAPGGSPAEVAADAAEAAKVDAARAELVEEQQQAEGLILGKYQTTEDLAAAYQNLQREYSSLKNGAADPTPAEPAAETTAEPGTPEPDQGGLSPAAVAAIQQSMFDQVGGQAEYQRLTSWAGQNLDVSRTDAYNAALATGDQGQILNALKGLQYDYMMNNGYEPKLTGGRAPTMQVQGFKSRYEIQQAMSDPRYANDSEYRADVERRVGASDNALFGM